MKRFMVLFSICIMQLVFTCSVWAIPTETTITEKKKPLGVNNQTVRPTSDVTDQKAWNVIATVASTGDEPNDLAVGERTYLTAKALAKGGDSKITIVKLPLSWNYVRFRCIGISDNNTVTFQVYSGSLGAGTDCELVKMGQLAFTIGTQVSTTATYEMADTLTLTSYCYLRPAFSVSPVGELVAEAGWDLLGDDILVIVPTTVSCDAKLLAKGF